MTFTVENLEFFMLIVVRLSAFVYSAPIFSGSQMPRKVKIGLSVFLSVLVFYMIPVEIPQTNGLISFAILLVQEAIVGLVLGFITSACLYIVNFSGRIIDMELGLSMANMMDPSTRLQTSITGAYYTQMISILLLISNMHYYLIKAIIDSFKYVPIGKAILHRTLYEIMQSFLIDFCIIGFRIALPVFAVILVVNIVLGVLAKIAPQMNMFVVGMQLKIFAGMIVLLVIVGTLPMISDFIFDEMREYLGIMMRALAPK